MLKQYKLRFYNFRLVIFLLAISVIGIVLVGSAREDLKSKQLVGVILGRKYCAFADRTTFW